MNQRYLYKQHLTSLAEHYLDLNEIRRDLLQLRHELGITDDHFNQYTYELLSILYYKRQSIKQKIKREARHYREIISLDKRRNNHENH